MSVSLRKKIAQMLCFGFDGAHWSEALKLQEWLSSPDGLGWLIEFNYDCHTKTYGKNIQSFEQLQRFNQQIKDFYAHIHPNALPLWLSIDVEGGKVDRLAKLDGYQTCPSAQSIASMTSAERVQMWSKTAKYLKELYFDLNFAPVVDLNLSPDQGIFGPYGRCFSDDELVVSQLAQEYIETLANHGLMACLKHFPGHGSAKDDSHAGFVDVTASFEKQELIPYQNLIKIPGLVECIMTAHVINRELDDSGVPATLSKKMINGILRKQFHYQGLVVSDDLQMYAIAQYFSKEEAIVKAIEAGADILMFCNQLGSDEPHGVIDLIEHLVDSKRIDNQLIDNAFKRIVMHKTLKRSL